MPQLEVVHALFYTHQTCAGVCKLYVEKAAGVPQESILGPLLFNIFLSDLFLYPEEIFLIKYADENTLHSIPNTIGNNKNTIRILE